MSLNQLKASRSASLDPNHLGLSVSLDPLLNEDDAIRSIEHVNLIALSAQRQVGTEHQLFLRSSAPSDRGRVVASFSVFAHEMRHFHDLLLTCYGSFLLRQAL